jgi:hypothetical protein
MSFLMIVSVKSVPTMVTSSNVVELKMAPSSIALLRSALVRFAWPRSAYVKFAPRWDGKWAVSGALAEDQCAGGDVWRPVSASRHMDVPTSLAPVRLAPNKETRVRLELEKLANLTDPLV